MLNDRLLVTWKALKGSRMALLTYSYMRMIKAGRFPKPIKFGEHRNARIAWYWVDIQEYLKRHQIDTTHSDV